MFVTQTMFLASSQKLKINELRIGLELKLEEMNEVSKANLLFLLLRWLHSNFALSCSSSECAWNEILNDHFVDNNRREDATFVLYKFSQCTFSSRSLNMYPIRLTTCTIWLCLSWLVGGTLLSVWSFRCKWREIRIMNCI